MEWFLMILGLSVISCIAAQKRELVAVDTFSNCISSERGLPCGWFATKKDISMVSLQTEYGNSFIKIKTTGGCTTIGIQKEYNCKEYPQLQWKWRVHKMPSGARENIKRKADSAAGVYVIFKGQFHLNRILKYVWSTSLEKGSNVASPYNNQVKIVVLRCGEKGLGEWKEEQVNILKDYQALFGDEPDELVMAIAVMSDSDNTGSTVEADYDDFWIRVAP